MLFEFYIFSAALPILLFLARVTYVIYKIFTTECKLESQNSSLRTVICIGSGGHTTEMLRLIKNFDSEKYRKRLYILADNDISSENKILKLETEFNSSSDDFVLARIPRSRNVNQSYLSSIGTTMYSVLYTIPIIYKFKPQAVFCNGPGTCVPVCVISFLLRCLFLCDNRIVFIESICRVRTMSLTGKILNWFADIIIVQWPYLKDVCPRSQYFGRLT